MINQISKNVSQLCFRDFGSCVYLLWLKEPILIDTSSSENEEELLEDIKALDLNPDEVSAIILTHTHWDHIGNLHLFKNAKIYSVKNINEISRIFPEFKIIETPGHTRDSICILYKDILFSGDTIFENGYVGRTDLPESDETEMEKSLEKLKKINYKILCPGHLI
ncbi:MAG: MBL fold metallo-hydrolase [Nanoarchaeota archaeon]